MSVNPSQLAIDALRDWLLSQLPARVAAANAANVAQLKSSPGPWTLAGGELSLASSRSGAATAVTLPTGSTTAAAVAVLINAEPVPGLTASADTDGRLVLEADDAPAGDTPSVVSVREGAENTTLGWAHVGEYQVRTALLTPEWKHFLDGWPAAPPDAAPGGWCVVVDDSRVAAYRGERPNPEMHLVSIELALLAPLGTSETRDRRRIRLCVQAVREALSTAAGRVLGGRSGQGVQLAVVDAERVSGKSLKLSPTVTYDFASLSLSVRVYCPALT